MEQDLSRVDVNAVDKYGHTAESYLRHCIISNHIYRPHCSDDLHTSIQRLINKVRAADHHIHEIQEVEESTPESSLVDEEDDDHIEGGDSDDTESLYEDAKESGEDARCL